MEYFSDHKVIFGRVERVVDGDTIRVRHCPLTCSERDKNTKLSDSTLTIRMYGIDSPELHKQKSDPPSQPFAEEAKEFTSSLVLDKIVQIKLLEKDKYSRAVGKVQTILQQDVSLELAERGLATMYKGVGADYDGKREVFEALQADAKRKKLGVWSLGDQMVSPAEFKRQQKQLHE